ncbi:MAG: CRTAC1 family protein, partial [Balneolaceae bacterium]|nr:CRTAC1 family protein [Balneolaceae bacterium]
FRNNEGNGFTDVATESHAALNHTGEATASMSVVFGDYDGNSFTDMYVTDENYGALYTNIDGDRFVDYSHPAGIAIPSGQYAGWGSSFVDYDNNMTLDIFKINGEIQHLHGQEDQVFRHAPGRKFEDVSQTLGPYFQEEKVGRGAAFGDIDNDGDIDIFISNLGDDFTLLRNDKGNQNNWILINLVGTESNRDGIGAKVKVIAGGKTQVVEKTSAGGYLSQNDPRVHFGLAGNTVIDLIEIRWPSGIVQTLENVEANQILTIQEEQ